MALLELDVDVGKGLVDPLPKPDQAVVDADQPENEQRNDAEDNPTTHSSLHRKRHRRGGNRLILASRRNRAVNKQG